MASVTSSPIRTDMLSLDLGHHSRTPTPKRPWHLKRRKKDEEKYPTISGGRSHLSWSPRGRKLHKDNSGSEGGSPEKLGRRKSIADLLDDIPSPRERGWNSIMSVTRSRSSSPVKEQSAPTTLSKRRKSITNLFSASFRGRPSLQESDSNIHKEEVQSTGSIRSGSVTAPVETNGGNPPVEGNIQGLSRDIVTDNPTFFPEHRLRPIPRVKFATSDAGDDPFEEPPKETTISSREVKPLTKRQISAIMSSMAQALFKEICNKCQNENYDEEDRPKTPDSYLQLLVESFEGASEVSSSNRTEISLTPSPGKHHAVQPFDFLADKQTPISSMKYRQKVDLNHLWWLPSTRQSNSGTKDGLQQQDSIAHRTSNPEKSIWSDVCHPSDGKVPKSSDEGLTWDVGDIDTNFRQKLQERSERYRSLEHEFEPLPSPVLNREYIDRSIKLTVAKMTKNYHQDRSFDWQDSMPTVENQVSFNDALQFDNYLGPQITRSYQFGFDSDKVQDSMSSRCQTIQAAKGESLPQTDIVRSASPVEDPQPESRNDPRVVRPDCSEGSMPAENFTISRGRSAQDLPAKVDLSSRRPEGYGGQRNLELIHETNEPAKSAVVQGSEEDKKSDGENYRRSKPNCRNEAKDVAGFDSFAKGVAEEVSKYTDDMVQPAGTCKRDSRRPDENAKSSSPAKKPDEIADNKVSKMDFEVNASMFRDQADDSKLKEVLGIRSICQQVPLFSPLKESNAYSPSAAIKRTHEDSIELRGHEKLIPQPKSRFEPITVSRASSGRRRIVSTAAVHVKFPAIKNESTKMETFDSKSKAVAALFDYKMGPLSNHVIYDPVKRIFHAQDLGSPRPDPIMLEEKGLELVWLPLQPGSSVQVAAPKICENRSASPATQEERRKVISKDPKLDDIPSIEDTSVQSSISRNSPDEKFDLYDGQSSIFDPRIHKGTDERLQGSSVKQEDISRLKIDWTASDEEYVMSVGSDIARNYPSSEDSNSICSTPKLESGTLLYPNIPKGFLDGEEILTRDDYEKSPKETKTWPQLGREFKVKHPELFRRVSKPGDEDEQASWHASDADSENSLESDCVDSWSTNPQIVKSTSKIDCHRQSVHGRQIGSSQSSTTRSRFEASSAACQSSNDMPTVEHIENVDLEDQAFIVQKKDAGSLEKFLSISGQSDDLRTRSFSFQGESQTENQNAVPCPETFCSVHSWAEAERAQARLSQPDLSSEHRNIRLGSDMLFSAGKSSTSGDSTEVHTDVFRQIPRPELLRSKPAPINTSTQPSLITSRSPVPSIAGPLSTSTSEHLVKGGLDVIASLQLEDHEITSSSGKEHRVDGLQQTGGESPAHQPTSSNSFNSKIPVPSRNRMAHSCGPLEIMEQVKDLNAVTPEDLNIRLVGKAARQSGLAKTSKVGSLIDVFKARGLMSQTVKPVVNTTTSSPGLAIQPGRRTTLSTRIVTPSGKIYRPSQTVECGKIQNLSQAPEVVTRVPTPASALSDADTVLDEGFGEDLVRVKKH